MRNDQQFPQANVHELALQDRDDRVADTLAKHLRRLDEEARELRGQAADLEREAYRIRAAVRKANWFDLPGVLAADDIESLCESHLSDPSAYLADEEVLA